MSWSLKGRLLPRLPARDEDSIITRRVAKGGKYAHTSYKVVASYGNIHLVDIRLHTGRTRKSVHFLILGFLCLGDDLYGGGPWAVGFNARPC